jgi:hypothetical protein
MISRHLTLGTAPPKSVGPMGIGVTGPPWPTNVGAHNIRAKIRALGGVFAAGGLIDDLNES